MLLQNCNLRREASLHDRIIVYSECTEKGEKIPPPFPPQIVTTADLYNSLQPAQFDTEQHRPTVSHTEQPDLDSKDPPTHVFAS